MDDAVEVLVEKEVPAHRLSGREGGIEVAVEHARIGGEECTAREERAGKRAKGLHGRACRMRICPINRFHQ